MYAAPNPVTAQAAEVVKLSKQLEAVKAVLVETIAKQNAAEEAYQRIYKKHERRYERHGRDVDR